mmetsp:Transcript_71497/g.130674  ORF Transcript_71497/g.130674 Transcript_71497/m.130674 type:complete len:218 (+) Transcript_71497:378-1031(+)
MPAGWRSPVLPVTSGARLAPEASQRVRGPLQTSPCQTLKILGLAPHCSLPLASAPEHGLARTQAPSSPLWLSAAFSSPTRSPSWPACPSAARAAEKPAAARQTPLALRAPSREAPLESSPVLPALFAAQPPPAVGLLPLLPPLGSSASPAEVRQLVLLFGSEPSSMKPYPQLDCPCAAASLRDPSRGAHRQHCHHPLAPPIDANRQPALLGTSPEHP